MEYTKQELNELHGLLFGLMKTFRDICDKEGIWYSLAFGTMLGAIREKGFIQWDTDVDVYILLKDQQKFRDAYNKYKLDNVIYKNYSTDQYCLKSHDCMILKNSGKYKDVHVDIYPIVGAPTDKAEQDKIVRKWFYLDKIIRSKYVDITQCKPENKRLVAVAKMLDFFIPDSVLRANIHKRESMYDFDVAEYWMTLVNYGAGRTYFPKRLLDSFVMKLFNGEEFKVMEGWNDYLTISYGDYMTPQKY